MRTRSGCWDHRNQAAFALADASGETRSLMRCDEFTQTGSDRNRRQQECSGAGQERRGDRDHLMGSTRRAEIAPAQDLPDAAGPEEQPDRQEDRAARPDLRYRNRMGPSGEKIQSRAAAGSVLPV